MRAPWDEAKALQRPLPDDALSGPSKTWVKSKNPESAAVRREEEWR